MNRLMGQEVFWGGLNVHPYELEVHPVLIGEDDGLSDDVVTGPGIDGI